MRIRVLGCAGGSAPDHLLSCYLLDEVLAVDAGALTTGLSVAQQRDVRGVVFTHGHLDHVWSFPLFLANRFGNGVETCHVYASDFTMDTIQRHLFNDRIWPDFTMAKIEDRPLVKFHDVEPGGEEVVFDRYQIKAVALNHTVPCQGYRIRNGSKSWIICGDTCTTDEIWQEANETPDLAGILVECSFTDDLIELAHASKHMTPALLGEDLKKLTADVPVHVIHMKPGYEDEIRAALGALGDDRVAFAAPGQVFE